MASSFSYEAPPAPLSVPQNNVQEAAGTAITSKRVVYVGGLADRATAAGLRSAFIPFGTLQSVDVPMDYAAGRHRGFAFVEFKSPDDAAEAIFNMDGAEYMGRVLRVSLAQPNQLRKLASSAASQGGGQQYVSSSYREEAIWKSDEWFQKQIVEGGDGRADDGNSHPNGAAADAQHQEDIKALR